MASNTPTRNVVSFYVDTASSNLGVSYNSSSPQKAITGLKDKLYRKLLINNESSTRIALSITDKNMPVPSSSNSANTSQIYIPASSEKIIDDIYILDTIYLRADGSLISSGVITIEVL